MFQIRSKEFLNASVVRMAIQAPAIAAKAQAGQFVILRVDAQGERIPLTIADYDRTTGEITLIFQTVGATTMLLGTKLVGDSIADLVGPLGKATDLKNIRSALVVGGGVGCAIALPVAKALHAAGCSVCSITGFRTAELVILQKEFTAVSDTLLTVTDDGSYGAKGNVCVPLEQQLRTGRYDHVFAIGPLVMMKFVAKSAQPFGVPCTVSMNPIMIDGTGMCGGCRLSVGGKTRFSCVDGPDFDGYAVDFDEAIARSNMYRTFEAQAREKACHLLQREEN